MKQVVLITGATSGLGLSLAKRFVARGDRVFGVSKTKKHWRRAEREIGNPRDFHLFQIDVSSEPSVRSLFPQIRSKAGRLDILINNAGYGGALRRIEKESLQEFQNHLSQNLISVFLMCKYALPIFQRQKRGWIINLSSYAGKRAVPRMGAYSASKFGVVALTQSIAKENPNAGLRCITICPGGMSTQMREKLFGREDAARQQSPDFVADKILEILEGKIHVPFGGDVVIRHRVVSIHPLPEA